MASHSVYSNNQIIPNVHLINWRESISRQLQFRKSLEQAPFVEICSFANSLFDKVDICKSENIQLNLRCEQLQQELLGIQQTILAYGSDAAKTTLTKLSSLSLNDDGSDSANGSKNLHLQHASLLSEKSQLEKKILELQEKLADACKSKSDIAHKIIDMKTEFDEKDRATRHLTDVLDQRDKEIKELRNRLKILETEYRTMTDEYLALQLSYKSLEKRHHQLKIEHDAMSLKILEVKREEVERLNAANDKILMMQRERDERQIAANVAARNQLTKQVDKASLNLASMAADNFESLCDDEDVNPISNISRIPSETEFSFDAHDGCTAIKWYSCSGPRDDYIATGGQDRLVKIWKIADGKNTPIGEPLKGASSSITSIDVETDILLASSSDMATRVYSLSNQRLNQTLTGHSNKVNSAKFLGMNTKIASGSQDRTIKLWDVPRGACSRTYFAGSNCYDLVYGNYQIISCHFDKKIRGWDISQPNNEPAWSVVLGERERIVSVDISRDGTKVACCLSDNTLKCVDLRKFEVIQTYTDEKFKVGEYNWRVKFSNDGQYISCGSCSGSFYIWDAHTAKVEKVLKGHDNKVLSACWSPDGRRMASIEDGKKVNIWI